MKHNGLLIAPAAVLLSLGSCSLVDEDLSECGAESRIDYELNLVTNVTTERESVLDEAEDVYVSEALRAYLAPVFTDFAHDVDLSFYDVSQPFDRLEHMNEIMDANQTSYTIFLPSREYLHTAVANLQDNGSVTLEDSDHLYDGELRQHTAGAGDTPIVSPHRTGLFTARLHMHVNANLDQYFKVTLYMVNSATALVMDTSEAADIQGIKVFVEGFATEFQVADSLFVFGENPLVQTEDLPVEGGTERCFASVHFPSRDTRPQGTKVVFDSQDPFLADDAEESLWRWRCYVSLPDGSVTETVLGITRPLRAGALRILKVKVHDTGIVTTEDPTVGVSVTLDWQDAGQHTIEF